MIDKRIAGVLYSYGYQLKDNEGNVWEVREANYNNQIIVRCLSGNIDVKDRLRLIGFEEIGSTYKILAREMDLTKPIEGVGMPLIELAKLIWAFDEWKIYESYGMKLARANTVLNRWFDFEDGVFKAGDDDGNFHVKNQLDLFNRLYTHHFNFFPEGTTTNLI